MPTTPKAHSKDLIAKSEKVLRDFLADYPHMKGDAKVYSQEEWIDRRERYGTNGTAILVFDGSPLYEVFNFYSGSKILDAFHDRLNNAHLWYEIGESWFLYLYEA